MPRLIDTDALKFPNIAIFDMKLHGVTVPMVRLIDLQMLMPTVDAAPVKHGRWKGNETCDAYDIAGVKTWAVKRKCSICGFTHKFIEAHMYYEFCPNCGAKMDLEGNDAQTDQTGK